MKTDREDVQKQLQLLFALGLCAKAGKLICGVPMICDALASRHKPWLVVSACDNAKNSAKRLSDKCAYYGVRLAHTAISGEELARSVGKTGHLAAVAITDENLAHLVQKNLGAECDRHETEQNGV